MKRRSAEWLARRERGSGLLLRMMASVSLRFGRRSSRLILYLIALYFFLLAPRVRRNARAYLRLALQREPTARDRFLQLLSFATTIHDRVYMINGQFNVFNISVAGDALVRDHARRGTGVLLMGAHVGSFEVIHSMARLHRIHVAMAMYEENAKKISSILASIKPRTQADIISLGYIDAMINISDRLSRGAFVGVLGDRTLGDEAVQDVTLLGKTARLPLGPMRAAAILRCPVMFMAGLYRRGNNYHVVFEPIADFSAVGPRERAAAVRTAIDRYASVLERYCRSDPYNWFNFFDFWHAAP